MPISDIKIYHTYMHRCMYTQVMVAQYLALLYATVLDWVLSPFVAPVKKMPQLQSLYHL